MEKVGGAVGGGGAGEEGRGFRGSTMEPVGGVAGRGEATGKRGGAWRGSTVEMGGRGGGAGPGRDGAVERGAGRAWGRKVGGTMEKMGGARRRREGWGQGKWAEPGEGVPWRRWAGPQRRGRGHEGGRAVEAMARGGAGPGRGGSS